MHSNIQLNEDTLVQSYIAQLESHILDLEEENEILRKHHPEFVQLVEDYLAMKRRTLHPKEEEAKLYVQNEPPVALEHNVS